MSATPLTDRGLATRKRILTQARQLLIDKGYEKLVMREVAATCEIKLGNLQLIIEIIKAETHEEISAVERTIDQHATAEAKLQALVIELASRWRAESGVVFATLNLLVLHNDAYQDIYRYTRTRYYDFFEEIISEGAPSLDLPERKLRARLLCTLIDGVPFQTDVKKGQFLKRVCAQAHQIAFEGS